jgi:ATP-binding cassette subfamily B protein
LENINLSIESGKLTVLIGESGSGKSTLLQIIQRFYIQQKGSIYFEGVDISNYNPSSIREHIRVIPQDVKIFNNNLAFNIALSDNIDDINNALIWCKENGLDLYFARFPSGYNTMLGEDGINVSGGQKQLIAFARALHKKPKMLIIDEGTSSMDRETENFILILLLALRKQMGIFLITHRIKTASKADVVYVLESGKISISGSPRSLLESDNFYSRGHKELLDISIS